ncbi:MULTISPECIES: alpha/beta hydrolase [Paenibacillus]|uniref:Alpha/beta hydrolase n=1 Tax=Paenibacillus albilobatus TaxID=2716884 RepID=A0A919XJG8_9BACL|nr:MULTISPECIES: alpha/beta hydrolase [Paenibacillus]GIO31610.1 alpha/beta hydrolase [Paenibacillus albilobatus]
MVEQTFTMTDPHGTKLHVYQWLPDPEAEIVGILQIAHGMCETAERYARFAAALTGKGYAVYAHDQRGHGLTAGSLERLGDVGENGFQFMVQDIVQLGRLARAQHPSVPLFLMGHSMGSFLVQKVILTEADGYDGFILSGTNGPRGMLRAGHMLASLQRMLQGDSHRSLMMNAIVFGGFNKAFSPNRTRFDWLSRDPEEVDRYIEDPFCGAICTARFFRDFFALLQEIQHPDGYQGISKHKPIYLFSGDQDPVGLKGQGVRRLEAVYRSLGLADVECRLYPEGRHEMLNEINRDEVTADVLDWLNRHNPAGS